jgi:DNA polymerase I-like protein with 3'-5' exonuclease and polymerase domains/DNA modification methylase
MNLAAFYQELIAQGFCLSIQPGGGLGVRPPDKITPELRETFRRRKPELLDFLQKQTQAAQPVPAADLVLASDAPLIVPALATPAPVRVTLPAISRHVLDQATASPVQPAYELSGPDTKVYIGDCRQVLAQLPERSVDLIFADPPFNIGEDYGTWKDNLPRGEFLDFTYGWLDACLRVLGDRGTFWVNIPEDTAAEIVMHLKQRGLVLIRWCLWHYRFGQCTKENWISSHTNVLHFARDRRERVWNPDDVLVDSDRATVYNDARTEKTKTPGKRVPLDVWGSENNGDFWGRVPGNSKERRAGHENQLPERYLERVILSTSNAGQLVLDPFLGSGTTCTVARALQRPSIGIEIDAQHAASAFERIQSGAVRVKPVPPPPTLLEAAPPVVPDIVIGSPAPQPDVSTEPVKEPAVATPPAPEPENDPAALVVPAALADSASQPELDPDAELAIGVGGPSARPCAFMLCDGTTGPRHVSLPDVIAAVQASAQVALDCETWLPADQVPPPLPAGATPKQRDAYKANLKHRQLSPRRNRVRLVQLATEGGEVFVIDCQTVDPEPLFAVLNRQHVIIYNAAFELANLKRFGFDPKQVTCLMLLGQLLTAGKHQPAGLAYAVSHWLGISLEKVEQTSDWGTPRLTPAQLAYAARDVAHLLRLHECLSQEIAAAELNTVAELEQSTLRAIAWLNDGGVVINQQKWLAQAEQCEARINEIEDEARRLAPPKPADLHIQFPDLFKPPKTPRGKPDTVWNFRSPQQVRAMFRLLGFQLADTQKETLAATPHPLAQTLAERASAQLLATTFGRKLLDWVEPDSRLYPGWLQIGTVTGRMAGSRPNFQNIPKRQGPAYRRAIEAPAGRVLVKADFSQIEIRVVAKLSGCPVLLRAFQEGEDLHRKTFQAIMGEQREPTEAERDFAKALTFGMLYGMSPAGLKVAAHKCLKRELRDAEATAFIEKFLATYPGFREWRRRQQQRVARGKFTATWTLTNRRCLNVSKETSVVNYPVQGTAGDILKLALAALYLHRGEVPADVRLCLVVHDEIVVECQREDAERVAAWLEKWMVAAGNHFLAPVPVGVKVSWGSTWGGDEPAAPDGPVSEEEEEGEPEFAQGA